MLSTPLASRLHTKQNHTLQRYAFLKFMLGINAHSRAYEKTKSKEKNNHTVRHTQHNLGRTYCIVPTLGACKISALKPLSGIWYIYYSMYFGYNFLIVTSQFVTDSHKVRSQKENTSLLGWESISY